MDKEESTEEVVLVLISLIILIVFSGFIIYLLISSGFQTSSQDNRTTLDNRGQTTFQCGISECSVNLQSGFKTCPEPNQSITINPAESVCSSRFVCNNNILPFAVQSNGSTNINGICEPNVECSCLAVSQCPNYILSAFTVSNGNAFQNYSGQRITFPQISNYVSGGEISDNPPIRFNNPATTFCNANLSMLPIATPGCNFVDNTKQMSYNDLVICMGGSKGCSGLNVNPCLQGTLALITDNIELVNRTNIQNYQYGCVRGEPCNCGNIAIYDTNFGNVICRDL